VIVERGWLDMAITGFPWISDDAERELLGNARPETYEKCRGEAYWLNLFEAWWQQQSKTEQEEAARRVFERLWTRSGSEKLADVYAELWKEQSTMWVLGSPEPPEAYASWATFEDMDGAAQKAMEPVYQKFYDDLGAAKEALKAQ
jgi:hypothetical protein